MPAIYKNGTQYAGFANTADQIAANDSDGTLTDVQSVLDGLGIAEDITPSSVSDFITLNSGWSANNISVYRYGGLMLMSFVLTYSGAWSANAQLTAGTLKESYRPKISAPVQAIHALGLLVPEGTLYLRNLSGGSLQDVATTYITTIVKK